MSLEMPMMIEAHGETKDTLEAGGGDDEAAIGEEPGNIDAGLEIVDGDLENPGGDEGEDVGQHQEAQACRQPAAMLRHEGPDGAVVFDEPHPAACFLRSLGTGG